MSEQKEHKIACDCQYFLGDRPCVWHKQKGVLCECEHYAPLNGNMLIIKLDAIGDVLRTTCLLPSIAKKWPGMRITWITRNESVPLLENNPYVAEVVAYGPDSFVHLSTRSFHRVINLDAGKVSSGLAALARSTEKIGYILHEDGYVTASNVAAEEWLRMGIFDDLKKANKHTYQNLMCKIIDISTDGMKYVFELTDEQKERAKKHLTDLGLDLDKAIIGIHTGGGGRWLRKQWSEENFVSLIPALQSELGNNTQILLFGGPLEREQNKRIVERVNKSVFDAGCDNGLRHFSALINCCSVVLSGDSLAMHIALAMERRVVVLFGPTSSAEIDLFGMGEKVAADMDCLICYRKTCDVIPHCMDSISIDMVKQAILRQLTVLGTQER